MQLFIKYNENIIINVDNDESIINIKKNLSTFLPLNENRQLLQFGGEILDDNKKLSDYKITNNSTIFLSSKQHGGTSFVPGFPNTGNIILFFGISIVFITLGTYFFYLMIYTLNNYKMLDEINCNSNKRQNAMNSLTSFLSNSSLALTNANKQKIIQNVMSGGLKPLAPSSPSPVSNYFYLPLIFYLSLIAIIISIYVSSMLCNHDVSFWIFALALTTLPIIFIIHIVLYHFREYIDFTKPIFASSSLAEVIILSCYTVLSIIIIVAMITLPKITGSAEFSYYTYLFPFLTIIASILVYILSNVKINSFLKLLLVGIITIGLFFGYAFIYVQNNYYLCT